MSKNKKYWERRAERNYETMERNLDEQYKDMVHSFDDAKHEIESQIHEFYFRYSNNNKISYEEAQKLLSFEELKAFKGDLETYRKKSIDSIGSFNLEVENLSMQARVTRLQALNTNIDAILNQLYKSNHEKIGNAATKEFEEQYYRQLFDIDQYYGVHFNFSTLDYQTIKEAVTMPINGANYSERIWRQNQDLSYKLRTALMNTIVVGKNPAELVKGFAKDFDDKKYEAYRLLNTEASMVHSNATMSAYEVDGIERYEILATLDSKTSQICREMDGKVFDVVKRKQGENEPPFHPNCRTTTVAYFPELSEIPHERIARDESGKNYDVPGDMTYSKWKEKYGSITGEYKGISKISGEVVAVDDKVLEAFKDVENEAFELFPHPMKFVDDIRNAEYGEIFSFETACVGSENGYCLKEYFNVGKQAQDIVLLNKEISKMVINGHSYKGFTLKSMVYHEYTHERIMQFVADEIGLEYNKSITVKQWDKFSKLYQAFNDKIVLESINKFYSNYDLGYNLVTKELGNYAKTNSSELISQAVSKIATVGSDNKAILEIYERIKELK
ncbi:MAG: minor capsid protein [Erysipelothrix sp.]